MKMVEFKLTMPNRNSWNGKWSGNGRDYLIYKKVADKKITFLELNINNVKSWYHHFGDGWCACITARIVQDGEKKKKSAGFCGYNWMVDNILFYNQTEPL